MYFPSRKERRAFAKKLGLKKKDETYDQWLERTRRSQEAGKQIHLQRLQQSYNEQLAAQTVRESNSNEAEVTINTAETNPSEQ